MKFNLNNIWLGTQESLSSIMALNSFLESPTKDAKAFFGNDDDAEEEPRFDGIGSHLIQVEDSVGIVRISGSLTNRYSMWNKYFGVISYDEIRDAAVALANDEDVKSILLEIDTGGGAAHGLNEVAELITKIDAQVKPVEAHTSMYTFSAGMWLASSARKISASNVSEVGSVGVIITMVSYHEMYKKSGIDIKVVRAGKHKALGNPHEPMSEVAVAEAEQKADKLYSYFLDAMVRGRPSLSIANKEAWAEGKTFFADEALPLGLIDEITSFDKVVANLAANYDNTEDEAQFSASNQLNSTLEDNGDNMTKKAKKAVLDETALAAAASGAVVETEEVTTEAGAEENVENTETEAPEAGAEVAPEGDASNAAPAPSMDMSSFMVTLQEQATKIAKLEANLETAETTIASLEAAEASLKPIAVSATNRLQIALGQAPTDLASLSASAIADMHAKTNKDFEASFSIGGPKSERLPEDRSSAANVDTDGFCTIHKPS